MMWTGISRADPIMDTAAAVTTSTDGHVISYKPGYFKAFQPNTAFDMIRRIPGFSFDGGSQDTRGFNAAGGNVLINTVRPATKDVSLGDQLDRIPANQVERIDVISGGAPGIDMQGRSQIANVIRKSTSKPSLQLTTGFEIWPHDSTKPFVGLDYAQKIGRYALEGNLTVFRFHDDGANPGKRVSFYPISGDAPLHTLMQAHGFGTGYKTSFKVRRDYDWGMISANASYQPLFFKQDNDWIDTQTANEHLDFVKRPVEGGVQFERKLASLCKLSGTVLSRRNEQHIDDKYHDDNSYSAYIAKTRSGEDVVTLGLDFQLSDDIKYQISAEKAYNFSDTRSTYTEDLSAVNLPASNVEVHEDRAEYRFLRNWKASKAINIEAGIKVETSTIAVPSNNQRASFVYPKPRLQIVWQATPRLKIETRLEREVSQLDFDDFAASVDLQSTAVRAGNTRIVPSKSWVSATNLEYSFWEHGSLGLKYKYKNIHDTIDHFVLTDGTDIYDARGNIGQARLQDFETTLKLPTDRLGLENAEFKWVHTYTPSQVHDPITGKMREISGVRQNADRMDFIRSLPSRHLKWTVAYRSNSGWKQYGVYEVRRMKLEPFLFTEVEYTSPDKLVWSLGVYNLISQRIHINRWVYNSVRSDRIPDLYEGSTYRQHPNFSLSVKKDF